MAADMTLTVRVQRAEPHPHSAGVWRRWGRDDRKIRRAGRLAWDEHARGRMWLTWITRPTPGGTDG
jgi:hypothetical protein